MEFRFLTGKPGDRSVSCRMLPAYHWPNLPSVFTEGLWGRHLKFQVAQRPDTPHIPVPPHSWGPWPGKAWRGGFYRLAAETDDLHY